MCCIGLRTLSLIVGWLHVIFSITAIGVAIYLALYTKRYFTNTPQYEEMLQIAFLFFSLYLMLNVARLAIAVCLIRGITQRRPLLMAPFIYGQFVILTLFISLAIVDALFDLKDGKEDAYSVLDLVFDCTHVVLTVLFLWPVYSLYQKMRNPQQHRMSVYVTDTTTSYIHSTDV